MGRSVAGVVGSYLPQTVTEMWEPLRDFAYIKIPKASSGLSQNKGGTNTSTGPSGLAFSNGPLRSVVAMSSSSPQVMVVTSDGGFYVFNIDMEQGGEGFLVRQFSCVLFLLTASICAITDLYQIRVLEGDDKLDASFNP